MIRSNLVKAAVAFALPLAMAVGTAQSLQAQGFSVVGGLNFSDQEDINTTSADATFENSTGYHIGLSYEFGSAGLSLRPGVVYQRLGTFDFEGATTESFDLNAVEVPIDVRFEPLSAPLLSPYLVGGPVLTFPQGEGDLSDGVEDLSLTADIGGGVEIELGSLRLLPELRYSIGVTDYLSESFEVGGTTVEPSDDARRAAKVMLRVHVAFGS